MGNIEGDKLVKALRHIYGEREQISLHEPWLQDEEIKTVTDCIRSGWVSSAGKAIEEFERLLADFTGSKFAVATVNGTAALHLGLKLSGVQPEDEVLVPCLSFVATANAVTYCYATAHFIDVNNETLGIDSTKLEAYLSENCSIKDNCCINNRTKRTIRALIAMHTFGHPVDLDPLIEVCKRYKIILIEDAAESLGSFYKGKHTGCFGQVSALSFNGNKIITTGGGGALLTQDAKIAAHAKHLSTTARQPHKWNYFHDEVGYNYRLPNINAALGCAQMGKLSFFLKQKRALAGAVEEALSEVKGVSFYKEQAYAHSNYWLLTVRLNAETMEERDIILERLHKAGIIARPVWNLLHKLPMYVTNPKMDLSCAEKLETTLLNLPSSAFLWKGK
jgi:perosamine synthetase